MSGYDSAALADKIRAGEVDANIEGVLVDEMEVGDILLAAERADELFPDFDYDSSMLVDILERTGETDMLRRARQRGHVASMNAATGLSEQRIEATGYDLLMKAMKPAAQQGLIKGAKGSGKTTKALDIARHLHAEFGGDLSILTNIKGPDEHEDVTFANTLSGMLEWVRDTPGEKLVIGDEWSSTVNAHANGGGAVRQSFSRFINALRKGEGGSCRLLVIGHEHDTDIAAILRTQSDVVIEADGKVDEGLIDCATVFEGWGDYQRDEPWFKVRGLRDVPESSEWGCDTNYFATFELDLDAPEKQIRKGKLVEDWERYQEDPTDRDDQGPGEMVCRGEKTRGGDCGQLTDHESGYCRFHRHQWDGEPDPRLEDGEDS